MRELMDYLPSYYKGIKEVEEITAAQDQELDVLRGELQKLKDNQYIQSLSSDGVLYWEERLNILADMQTESLEFRRERLLNRRASKPPFTKKFLMQRLDKIIGAGKYILDIDYNGYTVTIESSAQNQQWYYETNVMINEVKPCNMVFINKPFFSSGVKVSVQVSYSEKQYNYRLGTTWRLGQKPFASVEEKGVVKLAATPSIKDNLLADIAAFTADDMEYVVVNNDIEITNFTTKTADGNKTVIEYSVEPELTNEITKIRLYNEGDQLLDESDVYIPVGQTAVIKHIFNVKEGV